MRGRLIAPFVFLGLLMNDRQTGFTRTDKVFLIIAGILFAFSLFVWVSDGFAFEILGNSVSITRPNRPLAFVLYVVILGTLVSRSRLGLRRFGDRVVSRPNWQIVGALALAKFFWKSGILFLRRGMPFGIWMSAPILGRPITACYYF